MQLIFVRISLKISLLVLRHRSNVIDIKRATLINTSINKELLTVTLFLKRLTTMRILKRKLFQISFIRVKSRPAYLTTKLTSTTSVVIYILIRNATNRAHNRIRR
ncbi:hypothetical protein FWJ32_09485 [Calorimonas adulescens]|uniref:Uncharacterized protein n=2 Tax=Calorimonas adulescens TaxID=2606906 RepID=A0A5D8Q9Z1_9THEO|nr:hypothetical protein FWJ32_09485 [Calorimonas adulescens]